MRLAGRVRSTAALAASLLLGAPLPEAQGGTIRHSGQVVQLRTTARAGGNAAVCLEAAPGISGQKRARVSSAGGTFTLSTSGADRGPHCAFFDPAGHEVKVRLEYMRLLLFPTELPAQTYPARALVGRTLTFRWVRD